MNNISYWIDEVNPILLKERYKEKLLISGFGILNEVEHFFTPQGYTLLFLLSESHFAIHTFPEQGKSYIELSSCVDEPFLNFINNGIR